MSNRTSIPLFAACLLWLTASDPIAWTQEPPKVTPEIVEEWMEELSNWGRWGPDDELGTLNLITAEKRRQAATLVKDGVSVSLARTVLKESAPDNPAPLEHTMVATGVRNPGSFSADTYRVGYHGYAHTHMDALCHMFHRGKMYNGFSQDTVTEEGCERLGIATAKQGIFTRGILMDIARLKGVDFLEPGTAIYPEDLEAWEKEADIKVTSGDVVFVRTGRWARRAQKGPWGVAGSSAGLHASVAPWLRKRGVAMLGSDAASDLLPSGIEGLSHPVHQLVLVAMGMPIFDNCDLEAVSVEANNRRRWTFLLTAAPLAVPGGTGSPLNPVATF